MLSAAAAWFAKEGVGLLLGFLGNLILTAWQDRQNANTLRELGQTTAERDQARAGEAKQKQLANEAAKHVDENDAIDMMERGQG
jgi:hypothetical protein